MGLIYLRQIKTSVAGLEITDLRQAVTITKKSNATQNRGALTIWNLSPQNETRIEERGDEISIEAGYPDTLALLVEGTVQRVVRTRERTARICRITIGDKLVGIPSEGGGDNSVGGITRSDICRAPARFTDFVWAGFPSTGALRALLDGSEPSLAGVNWFESDGLIRFGPQARNAPNSGGGQQTQTDAPTIMLSPQTGLIESPVETDEGLQVRCFMDPAIQVGCTVELESEAVNGSFKCVALRHTGDNWTNDFTSNLELREME